MKRYNLILLSTALVVIACSYADAQSFYTFRRDRNFMVNVATGASNYFGELVNPGELGKLKPNLFIGAEYYFTNRISARAEVGWFKISGDDKDADDDRRQRNLSFVANNFEMNATGAIYLFPQEQRFYQRPKINFYVFAGVGLLYSNPKAELNGKKYALQPLMTENIKYSRFQPVIPFGGGIKVKTNPFFNVIVEAGYRKTFTDYLDDVSSVRYVDPSLLKNDIARALSDRRPEIGTQPENPLTQGKRGNPTKDDNYFILNVKVQYYLPYEIFRDSQRKLYRSKRKSYYRRR